MSVLYSLKRAVSRSNIIVTVGGFCEKPFLPSILATAIGSSCASVDYEALGFVKPKNPIFLPKESLPLITSKGIIGGCIIEHPKQAIIMLTEDRAVRNEILMELVYPYVVDYYYSLDRRCQPAVSIKESEEGSPSVKVSETLVEEPEMPEVIADLPEESILPEEIGEEIANGFKVDKNTETSSEEEPVPETEVEPEAGFKVDGDVSKVGVRDGEKSDDENKSDSNQFSGLVNNDMNFIIEKEGNDIHRKKNVILLVLFIMFAVVGMLLLGYVIYKSSDTSVSDKLSMLARRLNVAGKLLL